MCRVSGLCFALATLGFAPAATAQVTHASFETCVQSILAIHGYDPGPIDGILGQRTRDMAYSFAQDWRMEPLPSLTGGTAEQWCVALTAAQRGADQPLDPALTDGPETLRCVSDPVDGYARVITGMVDGDPVELRVDARFGGAVGSLTWRGMEFLNIYDHGRQISYAWHLNDHGECLNPTEPGAAQDFFLQSSTTEVHEICGLAPNHLSTAVSPAYWTAPGEPAFCDNGTEFGVNTTLVSENDFAREVVIGYEGLENVILFDATITLEQDYRSLRVEAPTAYLTHDFTARYSFDPGDGTLIPRPDSMELYEPFAFVHTSTLPAVLATEDGAYALGAFTAMTGAVYQLLHYDVPNPYDANNKWNIRISFVPAPAGDYEFRTFAVIGTLEQVRDGLVALAALHPVDVTLGEGFVDRFDCQWIEGWAWDPDAPDMPMVVDVTNRETGEVVLSVTADTPRADLPEALGDNGEHAYSFQTREVLPEGGTASFALSVRASIEGLPATPLVPNRIDLTCS